MMRVLAILTLLITGLQLQAQQPFYAYVESENRQPFYILLNGKTYSSSESGYVILPQLNPGTIEFSLGFPKNAFPEQRFKINIDKKDVGFQLKNLGDKGWNLFNFQTLSLTPSASPGTEKKNSALTGEKKTDQFSALLANVVNDSSILYSATPVASASVEEPKKQALVFRDSSLPNNHPLPADTIRTAVVKQSAPPAEQMVVKEKPVADSAGKTTAMAPSKKEDSAVVKTTTAITTAEKDTVAAKPVVVNEPPRTDSSAVAAVKENTIAKPSGVLKIAEQNNANEKMMIYLSGTDTIQLSILLDTTVEVKRVVPNGTVTSAPVVNTATPSTQSKSALTKADCKMYASAQEVDKLRVRMIAGKTTQDKLAAASKTFKLRCFSVNQVRALAEVFKDDTARYEFYELAYLHVSDQYNFRGLSETISDATVMERFKELVSR